MMNGVSFIRHGVNRRDFLRNVAAAGIASAVMGRSEIANAGEVESSVPVSEESGTSDALHRLEPVPIEQVVIDDEFWSPKRKVWQETTIRDCFT